VRKPDILVFFNKEALRFAVLLLLAEQWASRPHHAGVQPLVLAEQRRAAPASRSGSSGSPQK
jgi:hypothetical protein